MTRLIVAAALVAAFAGPAAAQAVRAQAAPSLPPGPVGGSFDSSRFQVTSTANEKGAYLWIVDSVQRTVLLCEKAEGAKDFSCTKKPLP